MLSRRYLLKGAVALLVVRDALAQGRVEKGIYRVRGDVRVNGEPAKEGAQVRAGDSIASGADGEMVFVVNRDAMLVRRNANVSLLADGLRAVTGAVLSVFASGQRKQIVTGTAVIGIRGTAVYIEAEGERTYVCTCYGEASLEPVGDPAARETVRTAHHEQPRYVMATGAPQMIMRAPVINHTDAELILLESLVGRQPPFIGQGVRPY
jgi:ribosomal 50S subunit-recycling heat shock protein